MPNPRDTIEPTDVEAILRRTLELSAPLHGAIEAFDEPGASYVIAGPVGVALFERDAGNVIGHRSGSPSPGLVEPIADLTTRHLELVGAKSTTGNSHLPALLLLCMYLADPEIGRQLTLDGIVTRPATITPLDEDEGGHDPELQPLDAALRAWTPLLAEHAPEAGAHTAVLEMRFHRFRYERHVPWEGSAGEVGRAPSSP